jgi:hypothetical protein
MLLSMSQLTVKLSDKADALIAQLQKEIFNRRRKKVSAAGVIETLVESGAKSQSDKRFATSWKNLISDIEKAAKVADAHGAKPANLTDAEWAMVLSHRSRAPKPAAGRRSSTKSASAAAKASAKKPAEKNTADRNPADKKVVVKKAAAKKPAARKQARKTATSTAVSTKRAGSSPARRMAKAAGLLGSNGLQPTASAV